MRKVETSEWLGMLARMIRAAGKRVGQADEHELALLVGMRGELEEAIRIAIAGQRSTGRSWDYVGRALGMSRQGARKQYGCGLSLPRSPESGNAGQPQCGMGGGPIGCGSLPASGDSRVGEPRRTRAGKI